MRQVGVLAAAGIVALEKMVSRLQEDHDNARKFAEGIADMQEFSVDLNTIKTNIIYFSIKAKVNPETFLFYLGKRGVKILSLSSETFRAVTHFGITGNCIDTALSVIRDFVRDCCCGG